MATLHIFNPSHDEALAVSSPFYTETRAARLLAESLFPLPALWAAPGDFVLVPDGATLPDPHSLFSDITFVYEADLCRLSEGLITAIEPWGRNGALRQRLLQCGVRETLLDDAERLSDIRRLSSRLTAVQLLKRLRAELPDTVGESRWCTTIDEARQAARDFGTAMMKVPWSGSGRGVFRLSESDDEQHWQRAERAIRVQGAVEAEPYYDRAADFAMEFHADADGSIRYEGISVFQTTPGGAYTGGIVSSEDALRQLIPGISSETLSQSAAAIARHLSDMLHADYVGPLGVDMMTVRTVDGRLALHPCVEINLRRTMGHVALTLRPFVAPGSLALFQILPQHQISEAETPLFSCKNALLCPLLTPYEAEKQAQVLPKG